MIVRCNHISTHKFGLPISLVKRFGMPLATVIGISGVKPSGDGHRDVSRSNFVRKMLPIQVMMYEISE